MSDNTKPPDRAFRGPSAAVTVDRFPNTQCCVTVNRLIQFGKIMLVSSKLIYSFSIQEELRMYISQT